MNVNQVFSTIDVHVAGEAFRLIRQAPIWLKEGTIHENNERLQAEFSAEKSFLLKEPRGHRNMHGCIVVPSEVADVGVLYFNHDERLSFKYSGLVATLTALLETGQLKVKKSRTYTMETIRGVFNLEATVKKDEIVATTLTTDRCEIKKEEDYYKVKVDETRDYLLLELPESIKALQMKYLSDIHRFGQKIKNNFARDERLEGVIVVERDPHEPHEVRSLTYERDGTILRSPGYESTMAILSWLSEQEVSIKHVVNTSIFNSQLEARMDEAGKISITKEAFVLAFSEFLLSPEDPLAEGFLLK